VSHKFSLELIYLLPCTVERNRRFASVWCCLFKDVKWVPCQHGMARPQVADGGDGPRIWAVAANILKSSRGQPTRGGPPAWALGGGLTTPPPP
jgi:hypothetical protein